MINLIPPQARKTIKREYWLRVVTVWFLIAGFAMLLVLALQVPTYVLINTLDQALVSQFDSAEAMKGEFGELEDEIKSANDVITHLNQGAEDTEQFSELLYELDAVAGNGVQLTQFSLARSDAELETIDVVGIANSRIDLSRFRDAIESHELFSDAELPISNLVKDREIPFSMKITMAEAE